MTAFLAVAALMMSGALLAVVPPLLARREAESSDRGAANIVLLRRELENNDADLHAGTIDRNQWESTRREIERRVVEESQATDGARPAASERSPRIALLLAVVLPMAAIALYIVLGEPRAISGRPPVAEEAAGHAAENEQMLAVAESLAKKLQASPEDGDRWAMLARTYAYLGRLPDALNAFEEAMKRRPDDARLLADYADVYAGTKGGGSLMGEPEKIIQRALSLDPNQPKALALAGTIAFQRKDFAAAARVWERAVSVMPEDSGFKRQIAAALAEVREAMGQSATVASAPSKAGGTAAGSPVASARASALAGGAAGGAVGRTVSGTVTLAPALAKKASPNDIVFLFARLPEGGAPLAVIRAKASELPLNFKLDDSMGMGPENRLSAALKVTVTARITKTGNVVAQPGDLEGTSAPVVPGATGVVVRIDKER